MPEQHSHASLLACCPSCGATVQMEAPVRPRRVVQVSVCVEYGAETITALCSDGSVWVKLNNSEHGAEDNNWRRMADVPSLDEEGATDE